MATNEQLLRQQLIGIKEQIEDWLDLEEEASEGNKKQRGDLLVEANVVQQKLAIVVGHTAKAPGGKGVPPVNPYEYPWNKDLAELIAKAAPATISCKTFFRDKVGIAGAYKQVSQWGATAVIELHYNNNGGKAKGTETLYGPACPESKAWAAAIQAGLVKLYNRKGKEDRGLKRTPPHPRGSDSVNALDKIPSCLIEPFFGDNTADAALGGKNKQKLAETLVGTFLSHFSIAAPASEPQGMSVAAAYAPPATAAKFISKVDLTPAAPFDPGEKLSGLTELRVLKNGVVFLDSDLSTDADGSPRAKEIDQKYGQLETAYNFANQVGQARYVNAEVVPYVVLPGSNTPKKRPKDQYLYRRLGLQMGDLAVVIWKDRIEAAMLADAGPNNSIGEGSVALVESLGWNPWNAGKKQIVSGIPGPGVLAFFFPKSKIAGLKPKDAVAEIRKQAWKLFQGIGGEV